MNSPSSEGRNSALWSPEMAEAVVRNLMAVRHDIQQAAAAAHRRADDISLIAVSKTHPSDAIVAALHCGQRVFGENRVQEALLKFPALRDAWPDLKLHLIGPLQTNKVRDAIRHFDVIQSLDRPSLLEALAREMEKQDRRPDCFIQVNTGEEAQKAGVLPAETGVLIDMARAKLSLPIVGLMCIPPAGENPAPHFALLAKIAERYGLKRLSMGMSGDFTTAIGLGATDIRVGSAIFGSRPPAKA